MQHHQAVELPSPPPLLLLDFPPELIVHILRFCDLATLSRFALVSHECLDLTRDKALWRTNYSTHFQNVFDDAVANRRKRRLSTDWQQNFKLAYCHRQNHLGRHALFQALMRDDVDEVQRLKHTNNFGINTRDLDGRTPLHIVCLYGSTNCLAWLIEQNALDVVRKDNFGYTIFHCVAQGGSVALLTTLTAHFNSDHLVKLLNEMNKDNMSPMDLAAQHGHAQMVRALFQHGAAIEGAKRVVRRGICNYPIHHAIMHGRLEVVKTIADVYRLMLSRSNSVGNTVFHLCVLHGQHGILTWFMDNNFYFKQQTLARLNDAGFTAMQLAENLGDNQAKLLLEGKVAFQENVVSTVNANSTMR